MPPRNPPFGQRTTDLVLGIVLHDENIHDGQLVHVSVSLELLSHPCSNDRNGERDGVHGLDLGRLVRVYVSTRIIALPVHEPSPEVCARKAPPPGIGHSLLDVQLESILGMPKALVAAHQPSWQLCSPRVSGAL